MSTASRALSDFASALRYDDLPATVVTSVKRMVLDAVGCALAATTLGDGCKESIAVMARLGGAAESTILGTGRKVAAHNAAFANGALVHALNYDSGGEPIGHMGVVCFVAPFAVAEAKGGVSGRALIAACAASCEVTARVTAALVHAGVKPSNRFMPGQFLSYFGAAAGAGSILGLDAMKMASAFGLALMHAAGSRQVVLSGDPPSKAIYGAFPNQAGVQAALLAEAGLGAEVDVLGAPAGLYAMVYDNKSDAETLTGGLGRTYLCERVAFKPWPASGHVAPFAEAAGELAAKGIKPEQIASVELTVPADWKPWVEPLDGRRHPDNPAAAGNAIPFAVAKVLTNGAFVLGDMTPSGLADARAAAMADRVTYKLDETIKGAAVALTLLDGTKPVVHIDTPLGSPSRPLSDAQLVAKFRDCCSHAAEPISAASVDRLAQAILFLEQLDDIRTLTALMKA